MQTEPVLAHARLFFEDYVPPEDLLEDLALADDLRTDDRPMQDYYGYVLLDFVTADRDLEELPLAAALVLAEKLGLKDRFTEIAKRELRLRKKQLETIDQDKEELLAKANEGPGFSMSTFHEYLRTRLETGGFSTEDALASFLPLVREVLEAHAAGRVAPLEGLEALARRGSPDLVRGGPAAGAAQQYGRAAPRRSDGPVGRDDRRRGPPDDRGGRGRRPGDRSFDRGPLRPKSRGPSTCPAT